MCVCTCTLSPYISCGNVKSIAFYYIDNMDFEPIVLVDELLWIKREMLKNAPVDCVHVELEAQKQ